MAVKRPSDEDIAVTLRALRLTRSATRSLDLAERVLDALEQMAALVLPHPDATAEQLLKVDRRALGGFVELMQKVVRAHALLLKEMRSQETAAKRGADAETDRELDQNVIAFAMRLPSHRLAEYSERLASEVRRRGEASS